MKSAQLQTMHYKTEIVCEENICDGTIFTNAIQSVCDTISWRISSMDAVRKLSTHSLIAKFSI